MLQNFWITLDIMGKGMAGIFTTIILIILIVQALKKFAR